MATVQPTFIFPVGNVPQARGFSPGTSDTPKHDGIDFSVSVGTPVHAAADGTVIYEADEPEGYGNTITLSHANGWQTRYAHLSQFMVLNGTPVKVGDVIGLSGGAKGAVGAGNSTGPHLHFEIRTDPNTPVDPMPYLAGVSNVSANSGGKSSGSNAGLLDTIGNIGDFFTALLKADTWIRVGEVLAAIGLLFVAYKIINEDISFRDIGRLAA